MSEAERPSVTLYADCPVFGGSDRLLVNLLEDEALSSEFRLSLVYRRGKRYEEGLKKALVRPAALSPVAFPDRQEALDALERWIPVPVLRWPFKLLLRLRDYLLFPYEVVRLSVAFRDLRPDLVHINDGGYPGALGCRAAALAARLAGARRVVFGVNNLAGPLRLPWEAAEALIDARVAQAVDAFVTASKAAGAALGRRGFPEARITQIVNGVRAHAPARSRAEVRRELGLKDDEVVGVMTAFFEPRKGHAVLVEALRLLGTAAPRVVLIGDGPERAAIERAGSGLLFLGYRPDAAEILAACDFLVLPSVGSEDMPLIVLDAMALAKPVVASALAGIVEEVEDGVTGLLAPPGDAARLSQALGRLAGDAALRRSMGEAGRRRFLERFEAGLCARAYAELYRRLLKEESRCPSRA